MKQYGFNKTTEFSKKQVNVIYAKAKNGELKIEKWFLNTLYDLADYYGFDDNRTVETSERKVLEILKNVFNSNLETAQNLINETADDFYNSYSKKEQAKCDRYLFV